MLPFSLSTPPSSHLFTACSFLPACPLKAVNLCQLRLCLPGIPGCAPSCFPPGGAGAALAVCPGHLLTRLPCSNPGWLEVAVPPTGDAELLVAEGSRLCFVSAWKQRDFLEVRPIYVKHPTLPCLSKSPELLCSVARTGPFTLRVFAGVFGLCSRGTLLQTPHQSTDLRITDSPLFIHEQQKTKVHLQFLALGAIWNQRRGTR